jgi:hypothetical protein
MLALVFYVRAAATIKARGSLKAIVADIHVCEQICTERKVRNK